jgi:hypothetical protein
MAEEIQKPIMENMTVNDTFSLVVSKVEANYDADSQKMQFFLPVEKNPRAELSRLTGTSEDKKTARDLSYVNLYSIQLPGERAYENNGIFFDELNDLPLTKMSYRQGFSAERTVDVEEARRLKNTTRALLLVRFQEPYAAGYEMIKRQLQVQLVDVLFFDPQTGKILAKPSSSRK